MALTTFSVGRDTQLVVMGPNGRVDFNYVTAFESRQMTSPIRVSRLDGTQLAAELPKGWEGSFEVERGTSALDDFISTMEQNYYNGAGTSPSTMYQYITEVDSSVSTYQFERRRIQACKCRHLERRLQREAKARILRNHESSVSNDPFPSDCA